MIFLTELTNAEIERVCFNLAQLGLIGFLIYYLVWLYGSGKRMKKHEEEFKRKNGIK